MATNRDRSYKKAALRRLARFALGLPALAIMEAQLALAALATWTGCRRTEARKRHS